MSKRRNWLKLTLAVAFGGVAACSTGQDVNLTLLTNGGHPERAAAHIRKYGCGACHVIPGVPGADGEVGPALVGLGDRAYIAGVLVNTPQNLVNWIRTPRAIDPKTAMPELGVTEPEARDIAAYLYSVK